MKTGDITVRDLHRAMSEGRIVPWYQPVVDPKGIMIGVEVLARWICRDGALISPDVFIPLAMASGQIARFTTQLLSLTASELSPIIRWFPSPFRVAFNMPASCLADPAVLTACRRFQKAFPVGSVQLMVEVTERDSAEELSCITNTLNALIAEGVDVALDDFGTGYANLNLLCQLPLTTVKLDRMFCTGEPGTAEAQAAASVIDLANHLDIRVLAEGVETADQVQCMRALGASAFQGFYFSPPVSLRRLIWRSLPGALGLLAISRHC